jgi:hypothetical protein
MTVDLTTPSIRAGIQQALVERLADATGWDVQLRGSENTGTSSTTAVVYQVGENKSIANNEQYTAILELGVLISIRLEDQATGDAGNPYLQLDRAIAAVEQVMHSPDEWGLDPDYTDLRVLGHEVSDPTDDAEPLGWVRLQFTYRHSILTPQS